MYNSCSSIFIEPAGSNMSYRHMESEGDYESFSDPRYYNTTEKLTRQGGVLTHLK